jgi:cytochrome P450
VAQLHRTPEASVPRTNFDHYSLEFRDHVLEVAAELNELDVSYTDAHGGFYVLGGYETVHRAAMNPAVFASGRPPDEPELQGILIPSNYHQLPVPLVESDGEYHRRLRRAMAPYFQKRDAVAWRGRFEHWATVLIDTVIETGSVDFARDIAHPIAFIFVIELLGLPVSDWRKWQEPAHAVAFAEPDSEEQRAAGKLWAANIEELRVAIEDRRARPQDPQDDLITRLAATKIKEELLPIDDVIGLCVTVMLGAVDTTASLITNALVYLDERRDLRESLVTDEDRLVNAIEEWLRYFSPQPGIARTVATDTEVNGCPMHRGDRVMLSWPAANHDPSMFANPNEINIDRTPNPHLAFGAGVHKCVGLHFARMEALVAIQQVLRRMPDYTIDHDGIVLRPSYGAVIGHMDVPATFTPGKPVQDARIP